MRERIRRDVIIAGSFVLLAVLAEVLTPGVPNRSFSAFDWPWSRLASWLVFGILGSLLFTMLGQFSVRRAALVLAAVVSASFVSEAIIGFAEAVALRDYAMSSVVGITSSRSFVLKSMSGAALISMGWLALARSEATDQARRSTELRSQLTHARLSLLRAQLHPHFLFNTLNSAATLASSDPAGCSEMVRRLGLLLHRSLETNEQAEVSVAEELETLRAYIRIEEVRFAERLEVVFSVDPLLEREWVPPFLLQPFVENAIRHGIAPRARGGRIDIRARCLSHRLILQVEDDGAGLEAYSRPREGIGLSNTRRRLQELYGDRQSIALFRGAAGGVLVEIALPRRVR